MTLDDLVYIDSTGYHYADYPAFLDFVKQQYRDIYGADIYLEADSQDGALVAIQALSYYQMAAKGAAVYNSFRPTDSQGVGLSRLVKINGIARRVATHSTADLLVTGQAGTVITNGIAIDTLEQKWALPSPTVIPGGGSVTVTAMAVLDGAVRAAPSTINRIYTPTRGWQTVNNAAEATVGEPVETDSELRRRQTISTANPSNTVFVGTIGAVGNVTGVTAVRGYENDSDVTDGNGQAPHSIQVIVQGGDSTAIADAIALHKTPGTNTQGTTAVDVTDSRGMPLTIRFTRPTEVTIKVEIVVAAGVGWSSDYEDLIKQRVVDFVSTIGIGNTVLYSKFFGAAYLPGTPGTTYDVVSLDIGKNGDPVGQINIGIDFDELPVSVVADVTIVVT